MSTSPLPNGKNSPEPSSEAFLKTQLEAYLEGLDPTNDKSLNTLLAFLNETADYVALNKWETYRAGPKQAQFHQSKMHTRVFSGGNNAGKTTAGAMEAWWFLTGTHPYRKIKPGSGWAISPDFPTSNRVTQKKAFEMFGRDRIVHWDKEQRILSVRAIDDSIQTLQFKSAESGQLKFSGERVRFHWFDEPMPRPIYHECVARQMKNQPLDIFMTMTPLPGVEEWVVDELEEPWENGDKDDVIFIYASIDDNPFVDQATKDKQKKEFKDTEEYAGRIEGRSVARLGRMYKFDRPYHIMRRVHVDRSWTIIHGIDPHPRVPFHSLWVAVGPGELKYVVGELINSQGITIQNIVNEIKGYEARYNLTPHYRVIDTLAHTIEATSKTSIARELRRYGLATRPADKNFQLGHLLIEQELALHDVFDRITGINTPTANLKVFEDCREFIWEIEHARWEEYRRRDDNDPKPKPKEKRVHMLDVLRYILNSKPRSGMVRAPATSMYRRVSSGGGV